MSSCPAAADSLRRWFTDPSIDLTDSTVNMSPVPLGISLPTLLLQQVLFWERSRMGDML